MKIGVLGSGQLGFMVFFSPDKDACASVVGEHLCASYDDPKTQQVFLDKVDLITYEFENVPLSLVEQFEHNKTVHPSSKSLATTNDRLSEKNVFTGLGIPTAKFSAVDNFEDLENAVKKIGLPAILKTRKEGYDGKGQIVIKDASNLLGIWGKIGQRPCILESIVPFDREVSIIAARNIKGEFAFYPLTENRHRESILRLSVPIDNSPLQNVAEALIKPIMEKANYVGILTLELFQVGNQFYANEMAPRVHNSGHWTIEGSKTSQFENHLRAITGLPLGETSLIAKTGMVNLIGSIPPLEKINEIPGAVLHDYGKAWKAGRKVGHITLTDNGTEQEFRNKLNQLLRLVGEEEFLGALGAKGI
jgi:5-(carboxyamino)imidazole ribonucleotide synthase